MIWRGADRFVLEDRGEVWVVDTAGAVVARYGREKARAHRVLGGQLLQLEHVSDPEEPTRSVILIDGLREDTSQETRQFLTTMLGDQPFVRSLVESVESSSRLDRIEYARHDFGYGEVFQRTQDQLCEGVERYQPLALELLRMLVAIGREYPSEAAVMAYLRACLLALFDDDVPEVYPDEPVESPLADRVAALATTLGWTAAANEAYRPAAEAMAECAELLGAPPRVGA